MIDSNSFTFLKVMENNITTKITSTFMSNLIIYILSVNNRIKFILTIVMIDGQ